jgi:glucan biosynthesis protein C
MLFGLLTHGATIGSNVLLNAIVDVSHMFRMSTFFIISGFFTAMMLSRSSFRPFFANRSRMLLVPLATGLLLLNPPTIWLIQWFHGGGNALVNTQWSGAMPAGTMWYLHLWFLGALFLYAALTPLLLAITDSGPTKALFGSLERLPGWVTLTTFAFGVGIAVMLLTGFADLFITPNVGVPFQILIQRTFNHFPYFVVGIFLFRFAGLYRAMHKPFLIGLLFFGAAYLFRDIFTSGLPRGPERIIYWVLSGAFTFMICCVLISLFHKWFSAGPSFLSRMTDAVYSFYLFHYLVIYIVANIIGLFTDNLYVIFGSILLIGFPTLFQIHNRLIAPSPLMRFLFNGKPLNRASVAA